MLAQQFYERPAPELARALLGCLLMHDSPEGRTAGIIIETEAYDQDDAARHSYNGETLRTKAMFGPAGHIYIYFTYGMHYCFNVVSGQPGHGQGVLIRALEPVEGIEIMQKRRGREHDLANGPAKLVQAMGITKADYGKPLFEGDIYISERSGPAPVIMSGPRIGIKKAVDVPWRFWVDGNPNVSY